MGAMSLFELLATGRMEATHRHAEGTADFALADVELLPVMLSPPHIFCVGINYVDHLAEVQEAGARPQPNFPAIFTRFP